MTASVARNETRLPRAVLKQSAAIAARYAPIAEPGDPSPADPNAPAPAPAAASATPAEPPAAPAVDPRENDPNYWKQRFNVTSGILAKERKERTEERDAHRQQITELQAKAATSSTVPDVTPIDLSKFYTPEQIEQYGEEQCRVMAKTAMDAARATAQDLIDAAVRPLREERENAKRDRAAEAKQAFTDKLAELVPNYQTLDVDPRWNDADTGWLAQEENGVQRQQLLNIHIANGDAKKIAGMFKAFEASLTPPQVPTPPVAPSGTGAASHDAVPSTQVAAVGGAPTDAEVRDFYKRSAIGKVKEDERVKFEARLKLRNAPG